ncbi:MULTISPECIES: GNAT family N-acetyltransferase [Roseobacteraceae]|uniref:GNAT family N-acetyltransferase n=1 Tax=Roseobacteraceae TaxID=2854170 RepID=UPI001C4978B5|nr:MULTISPECIES: GNAT family N-acetyltransferase [Roseobacteraceae]MBV7408876.1 GNAT family N-acetyltransferase [Maritimibacter sp. DP1N21-5]MBY5934437.1 GNAT family N-acetyltransferase [Tateyamaria omphalii]
MPITIRKMRETDVPEVVTMISGLAACHDDVPDIDPDRLARDALGKDPWMTVLVADGGSRLVGYAALMREAQLHFGARGMNLHHLFVCRDARGNNVGAALVRACREMAHSQECSFMTVGTHPDNHKAKRFYEREGFLRRSGTGPRFSVRLDQPPT